MNRTGEVYIRLFASSGRLLGLRRKAAVTRMVEANPPRARWIGAERARLISAAENQSTGKEIISGGFWYKRGTIPDRETVAQMMFKQDWIEEKMLDSISA